VQDVYGIVGHTHTYTQKQAHRDCCDGAKNGYCSRDDAYLGVFCGSLTMQVHVIKSVELYNFYGTQFERYFLVYI
jgi:hypothetical protein